MSPRLISLSVVVFVAANIGIASAQILRGTTEHGAPIILSPDGRWRYSERESFQRPPAASRALKGPMVGYTLWINDAKWRVSKRLQDDEHKDYVLRHAKGDAYVMVIAERIAIPLDTLKKVALSNAQAAAPDTKLVREEQRSVNGQPMLMLHLDGTAGGIQFSWLGYYYSGPKGTVQVIAYTGRNLLDEYRADLEEILNGLVID